MNVVIPIASGKGGVGKTILAANLAVALAGLGKTVIAVDLDLGGSNLHTCLGVRNNRPGIGAFILKQAETLESLVMETDVPRLFLITGDSLIPGTANLPFFMKTRILKEIGGLTADYVLIDLGSGSAFNTIDFFLASSSGLVLTTPETTAVLNAYSFLKTCLYRLLFRSFPARGPERALIGSFIVNRIEGGPESFASLVERLTRVSDDAGRTAAEKLGAFNPRIVLNMGRSESDLHLGSKLGQISRKNLGLELEYIAYLNCEPLVSRSIAERRPIMVCYPNSAYSRGVQMLARRILNNAAQAAPHLFEDEADVVYQG